ncbi:MAG: hypothetical protein ACE5EK_04885 [Nitrospinales bacterium]
MAAAPTEDSLSQEAGQILQLYLPPAYLKFTPVTPEALPGRLQFSTGEAALMWPWTAAAETGGAIIVARDMTGQPETLWALPSRPDHGLRGEQSLQ